VHEVVLFPLCEKFGTEKKKKEKGMHAMFPLCETPSRKEKEN
jgi:hypothetical protein